MGPLKRKVSVRSNKKIITYRKEFLDWSVLSNMTNPGNKVMLVYGDGSKVLTTFETVANFEEVFGPHFSTRNPTPEELRNLPLFTPPKVSILQ